ncbi:GNAT family N-acetyltransferase [Blastococcus xanthinilyticus]|nr:GNAT family N-acetyltransferase [Blastococcus xanthinilyticus]
MLDAVEIRERTEADLPGCVAALRAVHAADGYPTWWPADPAGWLDPAGTAAAWVAVDEAGAPRGHVCVVRGVDDPVAAAAAGVPTGDLVAISRLFVDPAVRGRGLGLGTALLAAAQAWAGGHGRQLVLDVVDDGGPAVDLYERLRWRLVDRRQADWITPEGIRHPVRIYLAPTGAASGTADRRDRSRFDELT